MAAVQDCILDCKEEISLEETTTLPPPPAPPPTPLSVEEEAALIRELGELRLNHAENTARIRDISRQLGGRIPATNARRPLWGPCTRCAYTWRGRFPFLIPRNCPRCGSAGWNTPISDTKKHVRRPGDPPNKRWANLNEYKRAHGQAVQGRGHPKLARRRVARVESFAGVEEMRLPPPPKPPSLVPSQSVRFADAGLEAPQPERSLRRESVAGANASAFDATATGESPDSLQRAVSRPATSEDKTAQSMEETYYGTADTPPASKGHDAAPQDEVIELVEGDGIVRPEGDDDGN